MSTTEIYFQVIGDSIPIDHGFSLYSAICRAMNDEPTESWFHRATKVALIPIRGTAAGHRLHLGRDARFGIRMDASDIPHVVTLAGRRLRISDADVRLGVPTVCPLKAAPTLYARIVSTRNGEDETRFDAEIARQIDAIQVRGRVERGKRRVISIHDKKVVGHELLISDLTPEDSLCLLENGLGGRRKMGCGVFSYCNVESLADGV